MKQIFDRFQHFPDCECTNEFLDRPRHARPGVHPFADKLYVVTSIFNANRYRNIYWNYNAFEDHILDAGAILYTAEIAYGDRHFEVTDPKNPHHLQLRAGHELWHKERALNLLINRLPPEAKYIAWIDSDVQFTRPDWANETLQLLQHYKFLQLFSYCQDLNVNYEPSTLQSGYVYHKRTSNAIVKTFVHVNNPTNTNPTAIIPANKIICCDEYYGISRKGIVYKHPGYCWAARREALDQVGGLIDWAIMGSADWTMACALFGEVNRAISYGYHKNYKKLCYIWQNNALTNIRKNVGYLPGTVIHHYHGNKKDRNYATRWKLLVDTEFDPLTDLRKDTQGLFQLVDHGDKRSLRLKEGLRYYARLRNEDNNSGIIVP